MPDSEFDLIKRWFTGLGAGPQVRLGVGDDAAILDVPADHVLHTSVDTHVAGRHFPIETLPEDVAYRAVASAASDLAAMGAQPLGMLMAITLPEADALWLHGFSQGCHRAALDCGLPLVGGDTTRGPLAITVTVMGSTPPHRWLGRHHARPGDRVCVSGTLGDAAMALSIMAGELAHDELPDAEEIEWLMMRFNRPSPRLALGQHLLGRAHAAIDISDGLLADAAHIAAASGVCAIVTAQYHCRHRRRFPIVLMM